METLDFILPETFRIALGWTLMHSLWQILIITLAYYGLTKIWHAKSAAFKYNAGLIALGAMLVASGATMGYYYLQVAQTEHMVMILSENGWQYASPTGNTDIILSLKSLIASNLPYIVNIWLLGAAMFPIRLLGNLAALQNLKKEIQYTLSDKWIDFAKRQTSQMGIQQSVRFGISKKGSSPITFGFLKPIVVIPASLLLQLQPAQLEAIITHELAHIKRNDYFFNVYQSILEVIFFYHPCFWWVNAEIREHREKAADQLAISSGVAPEDLAYALAEVLNHSVENNPEVALAAGKNKNTTLERIKLILGYSDTKPKFPSIISYTMITTLILSATLALASSTNSQNDLLTKVSDNITLDLPKYEKVLDTIPEKKKVMEFEVIEEVNGDKEKGEDEKVIKRMVIINGDTQITKSPKIVMRKHMLDSLPHKLDTSVFKKKDWERIEKLLEENAHKMEIAGEDLQKRIMIWTQENGPRLEELQNKLKDKEVVIVERNKQITAELEPKLKELEAKMEEWQKEFAPKMEEFQQKMEEWQKKNDHHFKELEKLLKDAFKEEKPVNKES
ncbi:M48 family metalloprotease [Litoribacter alkaliphilus]|uniref:M48 family metalloprotease n=1 Tax=Litoribacter ruber TaxID=702568 RepID=A0AAP2G3J6_9BACT|nr:M56 family metallopeptidase [Litoribacter alkaliphilus]MBS9522563.1 M48 family metalloprotease [Litoribacter alkaliphilus]